jgi:acyl carrier protein
LPAKSSAQDQRSSAILEQIDAADHSAAVELMRGHVIQNISGVLRLEASRIPLDKPMKSLGLDSLMALELRNRLERSLKQKLSSAIIWNYPTIEILSDHLLEKIGKAPNGAPAPIHVQPAAAPCEVSPIEVAPIEEMSLEDLLAAELAGAEELLRETAI